MTFPVVIAELATVDTADGTTHPITWPTIGGGILPNDLALICYGLDGSPTTTLPDGTYVKLHDAANGATCKLLVAYRRMLGGETGTFNVGTSTSEQGGCRVFIIRGAHLTNPPECTAGATGTDAAPNPASLSPSFGADDVLWFAAEGHDTDVIASAAPASYTDLTSDKSTGASGSAAGCATGRRLLNAASENPGTFTLSGSVAWRAVTVGIQPAVPTSGGRGGHRSGGGFPGHPGRN